MPIDQGYQSINANRHLLVLAVDKVIRELLAGRGLPFAIVVGDEKMTTASVTTNCAKLEQALPMLATVTDYLLKNSGKVVPQQAILMPPPGTKLS